MLSRVIYEANTLRDISLSMKKKRILRNLFELERIIFFNRFQNAIDYASKIMKSVSKNKSFSKNDYVNVRKALRIIYTERRIFSKPNQMYHRAKDIASELTKKDWIPVKMKETGNGALFLPLLWENDYELIFGKENRGSLLYVLNDDLQARSMYEKINKEFFYIENIDSLFISIENYKSLNGDKKLPSDETLIFALRNPINIGSDIVLSRIDCIFFSTIHSDAFKVNTICSLLNLLYTQKIVLYFKKDERKITNFCQNKGVVDMNVQTQDWNSVKRIELSPKDYSTMRDEWLVVIRDTIDKELAVNPQYLNSSAKDIIVLLPTHRDIQEFYQYYDGECQTHKVFQLHENTPSSKIAEMLCFSPQPRLILTNKVSDLSYGHFFARVCIETFKEEKVVLTLQKQKEIMEAQNKEALRIAILKRILFRIFALILLSFLIVGLFILSYKKLAYRRKSIAIKPGYNLHLNITNCYVYVQDGKFSSGMNLNYTMAGAFSFTKKRSKVVTKTNKTTKYLYLKLMNTLSHESCKINIMLGEKDASYLESFKLDCQERCFLIIESKRFNVTKTFNVNGEKAEMNAIKLQTNFFSFTSVHRLLQLSDFTLEKGANIHLKHGDIILQSTKSYTLNWTLSLPSFCFSAPLYSPYVIKKCKAVNITDIESKLFAAQDAYKNYLAKQAAKKKANATKAKAKAKAIAAKKTKNIVGHNKRLHFLFRILKKNNCKQNCKKKRYKKSKKGFTC